MHNKTYPLVLGLPLLFACASSPPPQEVVVVAPEPAPAPAPAVEENPFLKRKVLVLPFLDRTDRADATAAANIVRDVTAALMKEKDVIAVSPIDYPEASFVPELGSYNMARLFQVARNEGIAGIVTGSIDSVEQSDAGGENEAGFFHTQQFTTEVRLGIEVYDVAARRRLYSRVETGEVKEERTQLLESTPSDQQQRERAQQATTKALSRLVALLPPQIAKIAWSGRIAKIDVHRYYITGGRATGLMPGQLLRVLVDGETIYDPVTGKPMGIAPGRMKGLLRIVENFGPDASIATVHSGAGFREQDRIEPFIPPHEEP